MNAATIIICIITIALIGLALYSVIKNKKDGKSSCGCGCKNCPSAGICHNKTGK